MIKEFERVEQKFLELIKGYEVWRFEAPRKSTVYIKNNARLFEIEGNIAWCHFEKVWRIFYDDFYRDNYGVQRFLKLILAKHLKLEGLTPMWICLID